MRLRLPLAANLEFVMQLSVFFAAVVSALLGVFALAAWVLSRRQRVAYERLARTATFHCMRCDSVYTADADSDLQPCPKCGYKNTKLRF